VIFVGIDDTDNVEGGGTGRVAREIAAILASRYSTAGVSRHQLLVDPRVPYTRNNSCNVIHLAADPEDAPAVFAAVRPLLAERCLPGSDPGLCVAGSRAAGHPFGSAAQTRLVTREDARRGARETGALLEGLGGTEDGVIGALSGVILAAGGNDGRFVEIGSARSLSGVVSVAALLAAGIEEVRAADGPLPVDKRRVTEGQVDTRDGRVRPLLRDHRPVLLVEPGSTVPWQVVEMGKRR
jgi:hypothetical protein